MSRVGFGSLVGAAFGLVFVLANAGDLGAPAAWVARVLAVAAFVAVVVAVARLRPRGVPSEPRGSGFGRGYRLIVLAEVAAILVGVLVLAGPLDLPRAAVAWVALVVGAHFFALAALWSQPPYRRLGAALAACGVAGIALAAGDASDRWIAGVGGVLPGALLLGFSLWGVRRLSGPG
jgi:hypothetical protein